MCVQYTEIFIPKAFFSLLGEIPYPGEQWSFDSYRMLQDGHRMAMPKYANDNMYGIFELSQN